MDFLRRAMFAFLLSVRPWSRGFFGIQFLARPFERAPKPEKRSRFMGGKVVRSFDPRFRPLNTCREALQLVTHIRFLLVKLEFLTGIRQPFDVAQVARWMCCFEGTPFWWCYPCFKGTLKDQP